MEVLELIKTIADISMAGLIAVLFVMTWRSRDKGSTEQAKITTGLIELLGDTSANVKDVSANIKACTTAITDLKTCEDDTQTLITGMRREVQLAHGDHTATLTEIRATLQDMPALTATEVETRIGPRFVPIQDLLQQAALKLLTANNQLEQLAQLMRLPPDKHEPGESAQPAPEPAELSVQHE